MMLVNPIVASVDCQEMLMSLHHRCAYESLGSLVIVHPHLGIELDLHNFHKFGDCAVVVTLVQSSSSLLQMLGLHKVKPLIYMDGI
jgi:hypothetical protein